MCRTEVQFRIGISVIYLIFCLYSKNSNLLFINCICTVKGSTIITFTCYGYSIRSRIFTFVYTFSVNGICNLIVRIFTQYIASYRIDYRYRRVLCASVICSIVTCNGYFERCGSNICINVCGFVF